MEVHYESWMECTYQCTVIECMELMLVAWTDGQETVPLEYMIDELVGMKCLALEAM